MQPGGSYRQKLGQPTSLAVAHIQTKLMNEEWFSDKVYWQVADQPGKGGPNCLVMVDLVGKEVKRVCHP